jgi:hypothetical protein
LAKQTHRGSHGNRDMILAEQTHRELSPRTPFWWNKATDRRVMAVTHYL